MTSNTDIIDGALFKEIVIFIPVNRAKCAVNDYHRDGAMRVDGNYGATPAYTPNSQGYWTAQPEVAEPPLELEGAMWRYDPSDDPTDAKAAGLDLNKVIELSKLDNDALNAATMK